MNAAFFRPGTSDLNIWKNVVENDEYRISQMTENDCCLDIGANTGAATYACIQRGAGKVIAFEPDPDNFLLFRKQLKQEIKDGRVEVYPLAVVGGSGFSWRTFSGVVQKDGEVNHGGAFLFSEDGGDYGLGEYIVGKPFKVPCIGFEEIVFPDMNRRLCKVDAEGSEFEIINKSRDLRGFQEAVGEYHGYEGRSGVDLSQMLSASFDVELVPHHDSDLGLFFALRNYVK